MVRKAPQEREKRRPAGKRREQEVLDAAVTIFNERGYADTSVEDIASSLGILKGSLYYYIDSKEDLLYRIVTEVHVGVQECLDAALSHDELSPIERLRFYILEQVRYNARNVVAIAVYYRDLRRLTGDRLDEIRNRQRTHERAVVRLLEEAREVGEVAPEVDLKLATHCVMGTIIWPYTWYRRGRAISPDELAEFCADYALRGIGASVPAAS